LRLIVAAADTRSGGTEISDRELAAALSSVPGRRWDRGAWTGLPGSRLASVELRTRRDEVLSPLIAFSPDGCPVVGDVRLDDEAALRRRLGSPPTGGGQLSLIANAYDRWGVACCERLDGDFAFALWDPRKRLLLAARDPFGVRPLYLATRGSFVVFASEVESLLALPFVSREPDRETVVDYLAWRFEQPAKTFFKSIEAVEPGHQIVCTDGRVERRRYVRIAPRYESPRARKECAREFRERLFDAVRVRASEDTPTVVHLSGGLDSSCIVASLASLRERDPHVAPFVPVSAVFPSRPHDEEFYIALTERHLRLRVRRWDGRPDPHATPPRGAAGVAWPGLGRASNIGTGDLDVATEVGARVILSGYGGDAICADWESYDDLLRHRRFGLLLASVFAASSFDAASHRLMRVGASARRQLGMAGRRADQEPPPRWLATDLRETWSTRTESEGENQAELPFVLARETWRRMTTARFGAALTRAVREAADAGIELRAPYLDRRLIEYVLSIPPELRVPWRRARGLQREAFRNLLPESVIDRAQRTAFGTAVVDQVASERDAIMARAAAPDWRPGAFVEGRTLADQLSSLPQNASAWLHWWRASAAADLDVWLRAVECYTPKPTMEFDRLEHTDATAADPTARPYEKPVIVPLGNVAQLVAGNTGPQTDGTLGTKGPLPPPE
jgi:asparagine synthase (glutamine-hydrolysing)